MWRYCQVCAASARRAARLYKPLPLPSPSSTATERLRSTPLPLRPLLARGGSLVWHGARYWGRPALVVSSSSGSSCWARSAAITSLSEGLRVRQPHGRPPAPPSAPTSPVSPASSCSSSTVMKASPHRLSQSATPALKTNTLCQVLDGAAGTWQLLSQAQTWFAAKANSVQAQVALDDMRCFPVARRSPKCKAANRMKLYCCEHPENKKM
ncbi:hypothetical protein EYF80_031240 [Liparis tanakae]|uniref:Uncharacterized protein n=1 Tax=Liparis tanakae TaxID=230148 RepID=A0A4Z2GZE3_9TELE|nr:hypothetical protein EYF80_031240 [Liparis tanakae]